MSITEVAGWKELLNEKDYSRSLVLAHALLATLNANQVQSLAALFVESTAENARYVATMLLLELLRNNDPRLTEQYRNTVAAASKTILERDYPRTDLSLRAFALLQLLDIAAAERFLLSFDPSQLSDKERAIYVGNIQYLNTPNSIVKLKELEQIGGELAGLANQALGTLGRLSDAQVEEIAARFRSTHTSRSLHEIFHVYVRFLVGKPVQQVRDLLGEPTRQDPNCLVYETDNPEVRMSIWFDKKGLVSDVSKR